MRGRLGVPDVPQLPASHFTAFLSRVFAPVLEWQLSSSIHNSSFPFLALHIHYSLCWQLCYRVFNSYFVVRTFFLLLSYFCRVFGKQGTNEKKVDEESFTAAPMRHFHCTPQVLFPSIFDEHSLLPHTYSYKNSIQQTLLNLNYCNKLTVRAPCRTTECATIHLLKK